jgi:hypothetical protein
VGAAREAVEEPDPTRDGSSVVPSTRPSGAANARPGGSAQDPAASMYVRRLRELEKLIRSETIAVDPDKGLVWVDATIERTHRLRLIVQPESDVVRLAAGTAADAGIRPPDDSPAVEVATLGGRKFAARKVRLETVQIGSHVLHDVECVVLPPEFGAAPALLGATLLERCSARIDAGAGALILTQIQVKPILRPADQRR